MASETLAKIDRAYDVVSALCEGKREWLMSIPARPDHDPDLIIGDALLAAKNEIARLARELEEAMRERSAARAEALTAQASLRRVERELEEARERERALREALVEVAIPLEAFWMVMHDSDLLSAEVREAVQKALGIVRRTVGATTVREGGE